MQYKLYHLVNSRSQRIVWLLEELELNYSLEICDPLNPHAAFEKMSKTTQDLKFPMLDIQDDQHAEYTTLSETTAILDYLSQKHQKLGINELATPEHIQFYFWKNFAESSFMPNMALKQIFAQIVIKTPLIAKPISMLFKSAFNQGFLNAALERQIDRIESQLMHHQWIAGRSFSIADIILWFPLRACCYSNPQFRASVHIQRYLNDLENRPAFQTALAKGKWSESIFEQYWVNS